MDASEHLRLTSKAVYAIAEGVTLDRDDLIEQAVPSTEDHTHAPPPDFFQQLIP